VPDWGSGAGGGCSCWHDHALIQRERMLTDVFDLLEWKRRIFELYAEIRSASDPAQAWLLWRDVRDELFRLHPQSPLPKEARVGFGGVPYFPYDRKLRVLADVEPAAPESLEIAGSAGSAVRFTRSAAPDSSSPASGGG